MTTIFDPASIACADESLAKKLSQAGEAARKAGKVNLEIAVLAFGLKYTENMFWPVGHSELEACESFAVSVRDAIASKYPQATRELIGLDAASVREKVGDDASKLVPALGALRDFDKAYKMVLRDVRKYLAEITDGRRNAKGEIVQLAGKSDGSRVSAVQTAIDKVARFDDAIRGWKQEQLRVTNDHWIAIDDEVSELKKVLSRLNKALTAAKDDKAEKAASSPAKFGDKA
jgi:hypothetical protein